MGKATTSCWEVVGKGFGEVKKIFPTDFTEDLDGRLCENGVFETIVNIYFFFSKPRLLRKTV